MRQNPDEAQKKWTQTDMAVTPDMGRSHLSDVENGKLKIGVMTLQVIAGSLSTTIVRLLTDLQSSRAMPFLPQKSGPKCVQTRILSRHLPL